MTITYTYRYSQFDVRHVATGRQLKIKSYLTDTDGNPFQNFTTSEIDFFDVIVEKSQIPANPLAYNSFMQQLINGTINNKYSKTIGNATIQTGLNIITLDNVDGLYPAMSVVGTGIQANTLIDQIRDSKAIKINSLPTADVTSASLSFGTKGWNYNFTYLNSLLNIIDLGSL